MPRINPVQRRGDRSEGVPLFVAVVDHTMSWLPEPRTEPSVRISIIIAALLLAGASSALVLMNLLEVARAPGPAPAFASMIASLPAIASWFVVATYTRARTRRRLARAFRPVAIVFFWICCCSAVVVAVAGAALVAALGYEPLAHQLGADAEDHSVLVFLGGMTAYIATVFLVLSAGLRSVSTGPGLVSRTTGVFLPGYALLAAIIFYAIGAVAALARLGAPAVSVIITLVLFGVGALGRIMYAARKELAAARTSLVDTIDELQLALDDGDAAEVRKVGLRFSRAASERHALNVRLLSAPARETIDALVSKIAGVPLPHAKPLDVLAEGRFRSLTVDDSRALLYEGCTAIRADLAAY